MSFNIRETLFRIWYWYVSKVDKNAEILFMNFGYNYSNQIIPLDAKDESNRYSIQLYHHLTGYTEIKGKDILEIGCGRGGGLNYIVNTFEPTTARGVDLNKRAISFCNSHYSHPAISFSQGDAQQLTFADNSFDVVFNVESSHRYPNMKAFLSEVSRILRPNGHFLYTDFRYDYEMEILKKELAESGLTIVEEIMITDEVVAALKADDQRRRYLVNKLAPKFLHTIALNFSGAVGSETYNQFASLKYIYYSYVLKKL